MAPIEIGLISDTHGLLRDSAVEALQNVSRIIHAGDIDNPEILARLEQIAPVTAVRGNMDHGPWAAALPTTNVVEIGGILLYVLHDLHRLDLDPQAAGMAAVIYGHSHQPEIRRGNGVLYLNPGSAGPRRFRLPVTLMRLTISEGKLQPILQPLEPA